MLPFNGMQHIEVAGRAPQHAQKRISVPDDDEGVKSLLSVTAEEALRISLMPQDLPSGAKNPEWLSSRRPNGIQRMTGSIIGAIVGHNKYKTPNKALQDFLGFDTFTGNMATRWGNENEDNALTAFKNVASSLFLDSESIEFNEYGLIINTEAPELAYSPDGEMIVRNFDGTERRFTLEIKCPYGKRNAEYTNDPLYGWNKVSLPGGTEINLPMPQYYFDQVCLGMDTMKTEATYFIVWTPQQTQVFLIPKYNDYTKLIIDNSKKWFWTKYIPSLRNQQKESAKPQKSITDFFGSGRTGCASAHEASTSMVHG